MKKNELVKKLGEIELKGVESIKNTELATNRLYWITKLYIEVLNEFNDEAGKYNKILVWLTFILTVLTILLVCKEFFRS